MSFFKRQWLQRMQALSVSLPSLYTSLLLILVVMGYSFLLLFPLLAILSLILLTYIIWQSPIDSWQLHDWLLAGSLPVISALGIYQSLQLFKIRPALPAGRPLLRKDFPVLRERIDELCKTYGAPAIHQVKLNTSFAIEIVRTPHNGYPFRCTNTLLIGLPLMSCMSPLHLKLLLAREIGHLALRKRRYLHRIVYLRAIWEQYASLYAESWQAKTFLPRLFFVPFASLFTNSTYPAVRNECFVKDQCLFEITPASNIAEAIAVHVIKQRYLNEQYWPTLNNKAFSEAKPPYLPYSAMDVIVYKSLDATCAQLIYTAEIAQAPELDSVLPNLRTRLLAVGYDDFVVPETKTENAANHFLGNAFAEIQKQMDNVWYLQNKSIWAMRYKRGVEEKNRLKILRDQAAHALLSNEEAREYLLLIERYIAPEKASPFYQEILKTNSLNAQVCYDVGRLLLSAGDESGIAALQMAMDLSDKLTIDCCQHIVDYLTKTGDTKLAQDYRRKIIAHQVNDT